jgi:cathepsin X
MRFTTAAAALALLAVGGQSAYQSEFVKTRTNEIHVTSPLPDTYLSVEDLPDTMDWRNVNGTSFVTKSINQHIPQYCGSCWAQGAISALADRIKIARGAQGIDVELAVQFILNCGDAGSCHGGDHLAVYQYIHKNGFVPYETCQPYLACSSESDEGFCGDVDTTCSPMNTCRTCSTFSDSGGKCAPLNYFPNASIAQYGSVRGASKMQAEIMARGPIACGVNAEPLLEYTGGVFTGHIGMVNHIISVVGWGTDPSVGKYWIVRNSWGEYWGEMGYFRIEMGKDTLGIESDCAWATPAAWTEHNVPCYEDGSNC